MSTGPVRKDERKTDREPEDPGVPGSGLGSVTHLLCNFQNTTFPSGESRRKRINAFYVSHSYHLVVKDEELCGNELLKKMLE